MDERFYGANTRVFWDVEDFPVPEGRKVEFFYDKIRKALDTVGYVGDLSVHAYIGLNETYYDSKPLFTWGNNITLMHESDEKPVRLNRMLLDLLEWASEDAFRPERTNFIIVSKDLEEGITEYKSVVESLAEKRYNVFLAVHDSFPKEDLPPPNIASIVWYWTSLFDGQLPFRIAQHLPFKFASDSEDEEDNLLSQAAPKRGKRTDK